MSAANRLYFRDCLEVMREDIPSESIDLIYLDPPFNSKRLYNAFIGGAQWVAFDDTWRWYEAIDDFHEVAGQPRLAGLMEGLRLMLGEVPQLAYLSYMANRLVECWRVLKDTGSIYLHCDPTMSHYLKAVMDGIFERSNFRNEITWRRTTAHNTTSRKYGNITDRLLFYSKTNRPYFGAPRTTHDDTYTSNFYRHQDADGRRHRRHQVERNAALGVRPNLIYEYNGYTPKYGWMMEQGKLESLDAAGRLYWTKTGRPQRKIYLDDVEKPRVGDLWADIAPIQAQSEERIGYPTQRPLALLERIIKASSNEGDTILDPFCGCGTSIHAAQNLGRQWIGIDICVNACKVIERRLKAHFDSLWSEIKFRGLPKTRDDARFMAGSDPFRFERWAASLVDGMEGNKKQRGDHGIDGWGRLPIKKGQFIDMVSQVKGGHTNPGHVQAFNGARQQAKADLGIFTCFEDRVTNGMRDAAVNTGKFMSAPVVQIYTVEDYFEGRKPVLPVAA